MEISKHDKQILQELAKKYMSYASLPIHAEKREMWRKLNVHEMQKPMVVIDQLPWDEINTDGHLSCQLEDTSLHVVEWQMRKDIFHWENIPVDMVMNPYICIPRPISSTGLGVGAIGHTLNEGDKTVGSHSYINQFEEMEDVEKIKTPIVTLDTQREAELIELFADIFDGIAPFKMRGMYRPLPVWDFIAGWMGVENVYIELMMRPELLHAIMDRCTNALLSEIDQINALGGFNAHVHQAHYSYTFTDDLPGKDFDEKNATTKDGWTFGMAQLFTSVSPAVTEEFEVEYMKKLFSKFGAVYYGCCERLDDRLDVIAKMPNVRKISCSPWSDKKRFAENLDPKYIMSNKPNPAYLAGTTFDEDVVRRDIRETIQVAKDNGLGVELILKDLSTVKGDFNRVVRWAEIANEETLRASL